MRRFIQSLTVTRLLSAILILGIILMAAHPAAGFDIFWHLRAGEWQVQNRMLLREDVFSHSRFGQQWVNHSWLTQIILYGLYSALGNLGLVLYAVVLATGGMLLIAAHVEGDPFVRVFIVLLGSAAAAIFWSWRPQMVSFFFSAVVLYLLLLYRNKGVNRLWLIPLLMIFWVNLHGGFAIGFILMVLATLAEGLKWLTENVYRHRLSDLDINELKRTFQPVLVLIVVGLVSAAAVSLNPYGPSMLLYPFKTVGIEFLQDFIEEWAAPDFHDKEAWPFLLLMLLTFLSAGVSPLRLDWYEGIMLAGTLYLALLGVRNIAVFSIVSLPVLARHLNAWLEEQNFRLNWDRLPAHGVFLAANWLVVIALGLGALVQIFNAADPERVAERLEEYLPVDAVAYMNENHLPANLYNSYNWGGYLIWAARDYPVYVDGRTDLYGDDLLPVFAQTYLARPEWRDNLDQAGINTVLVERSSPLAELLFVDDDWERVYKDDVAVILVRRDALE